MRPVPDQPPQPHQPDDVTPADATHDTDAAAEGLAPEDPATDHPGIDPADLEATLRVLGQLHELPKGHPDIETVKRAAGRMYKAVRKARRAEARRAERQPLLEADQRLMERTATGSPQRIDDETAGILLETPTGLAGPGHVIGHLNIPRGCYICHQKFTAVDSFYHWLCPDCAGDSHARRDQHTDLRGKRALLTGGRAKIGMYIALMLLRDGAELTITTRFPRDAARRFAAQPDQADWIDRLHIVGIDLRDPTQVIALADEVAAGGPLDILINNACQTVRRTPGSYSHLTEGEKQPLVGDELRPSMLAFDRISEAHPAALVGSLSEHAVAHVEGGALTASDMTRLALRAGSASLEAHRAGTALDAGGLLPDVATQNSWTQKVQEVDPMELLEVQLCNSVAPFLLVSRLRPALAAAVQAGARRSYVVNVSAMEGQFSRRYKGSGHPHTNMAKAALNMLTRTSAKEMLETDGILMTAVDTGWITDERPHHEKLRIAAEGWHAPLDLVDGAARVYDPIVRGEAGEDLYGVFLKDFEPHPW
ncbi:short-chain dehydrogenase [Kytococcus schroeteri]|uniref:Short-chain dehydrogenase n=1 Tax=Kytococcus schroeteri TaxID=138300 RepID=A0A2I1PCR3_9MICO|nr:short-chain dehydrogenase [Kytococcus schroeteri]